MIWYPITATIVSLLLGAGLGWWLESGHSSKFVRGLGLSILSGCIGFMLSLIYVIGTDICVLKEGQDTIRRSHGGVTRYLSALDQNLIIQRDNPFRKLADSEFEAINERLDALKRHEVSLSRDRIMEKWEMLIRASVCTIDATNIVTPEEWGKLDANLGIRAQQEAVDRDVRIRRIFIYEENDPGYKERLLKLAGPQQKIKAANLNSSRCIEMKQISHVKINNDPVLLKWVSELKTRDVVIFDSKVVFATHVDNVAREVQSSTAWLDPDKVDLAQKYFNRLWGEADTVAGSSEGNPISKKCEAEASPEE